ncbi:integron [Qipengyuania seohaensis]|uniref:integron n=1 Tax=Qipengyuania seohaensis TaxID=266951 RepID=UPI000C22A5CD|nr:integron [Qipengyuania seohaensis]
MIRTAIVIPALALALAACSQEAEEAPAGDEVATAPADAALAARPVMYGGEANMDACGSAGTVGALDTLEGQVLTVHSAPDAAANQTDLLQPGQLVSICENEGDWVGVVYSKSAADCGTGTPVADRRAYDGQCQSGWINGTYLTNQAG